MGEREFEAEKAKVNGLQSLRKELVLRSALRSSKGSEEGRAVISVKHLQQGVLRGQKFEAVEDETKHICSRPPALESELFKGKTVITRHGISLCNNRWSGRKDAKNSQESDHVLQLDQTSTLTGVEKGSSVTNINNLKLIQQTNTITTKTNDPSGNFQSLSTTSELVTPKIVGTTEVLQDLSPIYCILSNKDKRRADLNSISLQLQALSAPGDHNENYKANLSRPNTQDRKKRWLRPLTRYKRPPPLADGDIFTTSRFPGILPPLPVKETPGNVIVEVLSKDLEEWMSHLSPELKLVPLNHLFIPGSHDSFSYSLTEGDQVGPDAPGFISQLDSCLPCLARPTLLRWCVTQRASASEQLSHGIRYFDIRVAVRSSKFYFVHGLFGEDLGPILYEVQRL
ncbi:uncharacterized protein [Cherax quadricarinatus]|uniref:uncharacterized protein n=1 Tax=Cherax quadricarinatus TaxID=27406 RepID=UPI00387E4D3E